MLVILSTAAKAVLYGSYAPGSVATSKLDKTEAASTNATQREMFRALTNRRPKTVSDLYPTPPAITWKNYSGTVSTWPIQDGLRYGVLRGPMDLLHCVPLLTSGNLDSAYVRNSIGASTADDVRAGYAIEFVTTSRFRSQHEPLRQRR
ncbi:hypothetical protein EEB13_07435 [Rhodococcus sp. WS3]|uniref:hypothetical protein n=1 Tax=Rhodococcus sp. WS3 TaxID=2486271 RepID=UPI001142CAD6|nr:hypothetical protein [Rhodococcus sp. WS3]ROZ49709.1 hypothetical protein EEB13_07435 [Rhodococcus sp. WS3]